MEEAKEQEVSAGYLKRPASEVFKEAIEVLHAFGADNISDELEAAAQAVRNAVIEECAKVCGQEIFDWASDTHYAHIRHEYGKELANRIRSLK